MKKIGFIDLSIDEWHANNYPAWIRQDRRGAEFELFMAYEEKPNPNGLDLARWCEKFECRPARSIEEIVDACDALCVLAPSNPEVHERLAELPLKSGKPVYIDKPFAPNRAAAERMFALAERHRTPMFSSSALRFSDQLLDYVRGGEAKPANAVVTWGGGSNFPEYAIHQLEMIVSILGTGVSQVLYYGNGSTDMAAFEYADNRRASLTRGKLGFGAIACGENGSKVMPEMSRTFENLISALLDFFAGGPVPVPQEQTIEIAAMLDAVIRASREPGKWLEL
jgi:predicted dehydrogenase